MIRVVVLSFALVAAAGAPVQQHSKHVLTAERESRDGPPPRREKPPPRREDPPPRREDPPPRREDPPPRREDPPPRREDEPEYNDCESKLYGESCVAPSRFVHDGFCE